MADILGDLDDLDNALFGGRPSNPARPSTAGGRSTIESLFGTSTTAPTPAAESRPRRERPTVSFNIDTPQPSRSNLEDLFAESSSAAAPSRPATSQPRAGRARPGATSLSGLFGGSSSQSDHETSVPSAPPPQPAPALPPTADSSSRQEDVNRIRRLEEEIERLNRVIDELKRKKKNDEDDLENQWKARLSKKETDLKAEFDDERAAYQRQISKLKEEHEAEVERLKVTQSRQLEAIQTTTGQSADISTMVDKVDNLQSALGKLTSDMMATSEKSFMDREMSVRVREQTLEMREEQVKEEREQLQDEKRKVYELNAKLDDLCKGNQTVMEQDKWRIRDEWARLNAEKQVFKDDQKYVMDTLEKQKEALDRAKTIFMREQHDLVVRVSTERATLEQEKNDFITKRNLDVRRLKEEANDLQYKLDSVEVAEREVFDMKRHFEAKLNELQELEASLMDECLELEKLRDSIRHAPPADLYPNAESSRVMRKSGSRRASNMVEFVEDAPKRNDSVRTVLKNHSEFLEKYTGQKVAAVAPQSSAFNKRDFLN